METKTQTDSDKELKDAFAEFKDTTSKHSFEPEKKETTNTEENKQQQETTYTNGENNLSFAEDFKVTMFIGFFFMFLDGIHGFAYSFISKYKFDKKELAFDAEDKEAVEMYFKTPRVAKILDKLPTELIGFAHIEYIYFCKFQDMIDTKRLDGTLELKKKSKIIEEEEEEEEEEEVTEEKPKKKEVKKAAKKVAKKKAVKKVAKKAAKKTDKKKDDEQRQS
jgi:hypothetical protein